MEIAEQDRADARARPRSRSLLQTLVEDPARFNFDAAVAILMRATGQADPGEAVRFHAAAGLGFVASDMMAVEQVESRFRATTGLIGLTGPSGVLPRPYTDTVNSQQRQRTPPWLNSSMSSPSGPSRNLHRPASNISRIG